jgi:hypothetical protein
VPGEKLDHIWWDLWWKLRHVDGEPSNDMKVRACQQRGRVVTPPARVWFCCVIDRRCQTRR